MKIENLTNKIYAVWATAKVVVQEYGHTVKYAKHVAAFAIKQELRLTDDGLSLFLGNNSIGKELGYKKQPHPSTFSKVRERSDPKIFEDVYNGSVQLFMKGKQIRLMAQDSTDVAAYSYDDKDAKWGHRTPSKKEQFRNGKLDKELFFGFKSHVICDAETEIPIALAIVPGNRHDKRLFGTLFDFVRNNFIINRDAKYLADSAMDSSDIREELRHFGIKPVIAINGRRFRKSEIPKDKEYGKRWAIERIFSRLKVVFGLSKNRFVGINRVAIHIYSCFLAYLIRYV
jgi:transposase